MSEQVTDEQDQGEPGAAPPEPGSVGRAFLAWRTTASALLVVWFLVPFASRWLLREPEGFEDIAFVLLALMSYVAAVLVVIPAFTFTIGRWVDRRTAPLGLQRSLISFGIWGFGFGLVLVLLAGLTTLTPLGVAVVVLAPELASLGGRLLVELKGRAWFYVIWGTFTVAVAGAFFLISAVVIGALTA